MIPGIVSGVSVPAPPVGPWYRFDPTGSEVEFEVPLGFTSCTAYCIGAGGGAGIYEDDQGFSGAGGYTAGSFSVTPGETLRIRVGQGGNGGHKDFASSLGGAPAYPGGGNGAWGDTFCGSGGGYSGVFRDDTTPLAIAGGGGGGSAYQANAGAGGGSTGGPGNANTGGTQVGGGTGTYPGSSLQGGNANGGDWVTSTSQDCGGGGGGYFGGGASSGDGQSGAGGSGFVGSGVTGNTYAGSGMTRPAEIPGSINGESTAGLGSGKIGLDTSLATPPATAPSGGSGAVWLEFS